MGRGDRNIAWIEAHCLVPEGKHVGKPLKLREWQKDIIRGIYDSPTRTAIISFPRKNGKTALSACLLLLHLCGPEHQINSQLYSVAQSRDQAAVLFNLAAKMVRLHPVLAESVKIRDSGKQLYCDEIGTYYAALSADASTAHGKSPIFVVHDELGQVKGPRSELYEAMETAGGAHEAPLSVIISTQAPTDADLLSVLIDDARKERDPLTKCWLWSAPIDDDPFDEATIRACNPAFGDFLNAKEVRRKAEDARAMPSSEASYRNLHLNQRVEVNSPFVSRAVWQKNDGEVAEDFDGPVYIGLDLSATTDLTAKAAVSAVDAKWHVKPTFWLPGEGLREKAHNDRVPYDVWAREGLLETTPGASVEYEFVAGVLREDFDRWDVRQVAFDRWGFKFLKPWLVKAGFTDEELERFVEFGQGYQSMSPALRDMESLLVNGKIAHGGHPVMNMCAANAVVQADPAGNRKLAKDKSRGRIDGMVALAMALSVAATEDLDQQFSYTATHGVVMI